MADEVLSCSDDVVKMRQGSTTLVLQTLTPFVLNESDDFTTKKLRVYAERIEITSPIIHLAAKDVGLFCNQLILRVPTATISVSGRSGIDAAPRAATSDKQHGGDAGKLTVCVEEWDSGLLPRLDAQGKPQGLFLRADGGAGGRGGEPTSTGGKGGNGGTVSLYLGHSMESHLSSFAELVDNQNTSWRSKVTALKTYAVDTAAPTPTLTTQLEEAVQQVHVTATSVEAVGRRLDTIQTRLDLIPFDDAPDRRAAENEVTTTQEAIKALLKVAWFPTSLTTPAATAVITNGTQLINKVRGAALEVDSKSWEDFQMAMVELRRTLQQATEEGQQSSAATSASGPLANAVQGLLGVLQTSILHILGTVQFENSGRPGVGGPRAPCGQRGTSRAQLLTFGSAVTRLDVPCVIAHPDECQMLSNKADLFYLAATRPSPSGRPDFTTAYGLYRRLCRRLAFLPALLVQVSKGVADDPQTKAYIQLDVDLLAMDSLLQLRQIRTHAEVCMHQIERGQDLYGHQGLWAPRLQYGAYYKPELARLLHRAAEMQRRVHEASKPSTDDVQESIANAEAQISALDTRIRLLTQKNGVLRSAASQIALYTPVLKQKRIAMRQTIQLLTFKVERTWNTDPRIFIDALTMIAFAPDAWNSMAQGLSAGFKSWTTVTSLDGQTVEKEYVVAQFGEAETDLNKLVDGFKASEDGTFEVDDPGATKLLATRETVTRLLRDYKKTLGEVASAAALTQLDEYAEVVEKRNTAVLQYNNGVQLLAKAVADRELYTQRHQTLGQSKLLEHPALPALRFWLTRTRYEVRDSITQLLYSAERSLQFWALMDALPQLRLGAIDSDLALLQSRQDDFGRTFDASVIRFSGNPGTLFPHPRQLAAGGLLHHLPAEQVQLLASGRAHELFFRIPPARRATSAQQSVFAGHADVRIDQVRVWLPGAQVTEDPDGHRRLLVSLTHCGNDTIVRPEQDRQFDFQHDAVHLTFTYDPQSVPKVDRIGTAVIYSEQRLANFHEARPDREPELVAAIGPFADWRMVVSEQYNRGLDLSGLTDIVIEFWGSSRPFPS